MANLLNNTDSYLTGQRSLAAYKKELNAEEVYIKEITTKAGKQKTLFMMVKDGQVLKSGLVGQQTVEDGLDKDRLQVAESHYINAEGQPTTMMVMFNGIDLLEGATKL